MKILTLVCFGALVLIQQCLADTIYQTNSEGSEIVLQRNAIVTHEDSSFVVYKHFDLKEHRVIVVRLNRGSLPIRVQESTDSERAQIVSVWKRFGFKASITDQAGKVRQVYDLFIGFYAQEVRGSLIGTIPAREDIPIMTATGPDDVDFDKIDRVEIQGDQLTIVTRDGRSLSGKFLVPTSQPVNVHILGITDQYKIKTQDPFDYSVPLLQLKLISFN